MESDVEKRSNLENYRDLVNSTVNKYPKGIAYKFKKNMERNMPKEEIEYVNITYKEFGEDIKSFSTALLKKGLENKRIVLIGSNRYEWCVSYLAVTTGNMVVVPLDKALPASEIEILIKRSEAEAIIFDQNYLDVMKNIAMHNEKIKHLICMDSINTKDGISFAELKKEGQKEVEKGDKQYDEIILEKGKMSIMLFTSGTTNNPKAVMLSQQNVCANIEAVARYVKMYPTDTLLSFLPIHHTFECTITFLYGIYYGVTVAFCDGLKYIAQNLEEYKISVFVAVPLVLESMYKKIQKGIEESGKKKLVDTMSKISRGLLKCKIDVRKYLFKSILDKFGGNLRVIFYGAAPMSKDCIIGYNNLGIKLLQGYGLTETSPVISCETDQKQRPGSIGLPLDNLEVKIEDVDSEGVGEITVKGPNVMMGYYKDEEATSKVLNDGWFRTGDYGYIDEDGYLYITGRKSDVIVLKNGKNVYPQEIEFLINKLSYVQESIVFSREVDSKDSVLGAKVVYDFDYLKEHFGEKTQEEYKEMIWQDIKEINKTLPYFKYIKEIIVTKEPLIKTTTQKIKRYEEMKKI